MLYSLLPTGSFVEFHTFANSVPKTHPKAKEALPARLIGLFPRVAKETLPA